MFGFSGVLEVLKGIGAGDQVIIGLIQLGLAIADSSLEQLNGVIVVGNSGLGIRDLLVEFSNGGLAVSSLGHCDGIIGGLGIDLVLLEFLKESEDVVNGILAV